MLKRNSYLPLLVLFFISALLTSGCIRASKKSEAAFVPRFENAGAQQLKEEINRFARINSMRAKMDLRFEDNSFASLGIVEKYRSADGEVVVQRPANILLKVQVPVIKTDIAQMTSDGSKFRVAIIEDGAGGKYRKFVSGTNNADYSKLQEAVSTMSVRDDKGREVIKNVNAFSSLRPQHFTEAILMRPVEEDKFYVQSEFFQEEVDAQAKKKSPIARILRGYYFLDELRKNSDGTLSLARRFWFDRVGIVRLARQQIYNEQGELESDITYGATGKLTQSGEYNLPLRIEVTRPKEKYKMSLEYQDAAGVTIGKAYNQDVFVLKNTWNLPEVDLDNRAQSQVPTSVVAK